MRFGALGPGLMGGKLGTLFARAGHEVVFSEARSGQKLSSSPALRQARRIPVAPSRILCRCRRERRAAIAST
jgi:predicted dinucleotide-binding enzyme